MKKGFTLIELLAVILILGVIALIAIPTVTNIINESKMQSFVRSAEGLLSSIDTKINIDMLKGEDINVAYNFKDGKLLNGELDLKGTMPKEGKVRVNNDGEVKFAIVYDKYCLTKSFDSDEINANELNENGCRLSGDISYLKFYAYNSGEEFGWINKEEVYYAPEYRNNIVTINFLYQESVPTNALISWDVSNAQDESIMAYLMPNGTKYDLYIISEKNINLMNGISIFLNFTSLERINFNNFYTSNIGSMYRMFAHCVNLEGLDLSGFDTSNLDIMSYSFFTCTNLKQINFTGFDTSNVTRMGGAFRNCSSLANLDLSSFDTSKVDTMSEMFRNMTSLTTLDINNFDTNSVTDMRYMFQDSQNLTTIYIGNNWKTSTNANDMLYNCGTNTLTLK